jgi:hypothetical protein
MILVVLGVIGGCWNMMTSHTRQIINYLASGGILIYICRDNQKKGKRMSELKITRRDVAWEYPLEFKKWGMPFKKVHESEEGCVYEQIVGEYRGEDVKRYECFVHTDGYYPCSSSWGSTAWTCKTYEKALEKIRGRYHERMNVRATNE